MRIKTIYKLSDTKSVCDTGKMKYNVSISIIIWFDQGPFFKAFATFLFFFLYKEQQVLECVWTFIPWNSVEIVLIAFLSILSE